MLEVKLGHQQALPAKRLGFRWDSSSLLLNPTGPSPDSDRGLRFPPLTHTHPHDSHGLHDERGEIFRAFAFLGKRSTGRGPAGEHHPSELLEAEQNFREWEWTRARPLLGELRKREQAG